ncbi:MAG: hypothetical protein AB7O96_05595 [Pseudobdellovibrionaceae bacterium]
MKNCKKIDLPLPPQEIIDECLQSARLDNQETIHYPRPPEDVVDFSKRLDVPKKVAIDQFKPGELANYRMTKPPESLVAWCKENLPTYDRLAISHTFDGTCFMPHVDYKTKVSLNLYLKTNPAVSTWYKPKREFEYLIEDSAHPSYGQYLLSRLDLIESAVFEEGGWYLLNASIPHSVEQISGSRIFVRVCFDREEMFNYFPEVSL